MQKYLSTVLGINDSSKIKVLDGIRAIAVIMVFIFHIWNLSGLPQILIFGKNLSFGFTLGHAGVDIFYLLSGFLLFLPFAQSYYSNASKPDLKKYFWKRARRILPAYYAFIVLTVIFLNINLVSWEGLRQVLVNALFLQNFIIDKIPTLNGVTWTLVVEVQFYILLPIIAYFFVGKRSKWAFCFSIIAVFLYRLITYIIMKPTGFDGNWHFNHVTESNILGVFDNFAIGMLLANTYQYYRFNKKALKSFLVRNIKKIVWTAPILFVAAIYGYFKWRYGISTQSSWLWFPFVFDIAIYISGALLILFVLFYKSILRNILSNFYLRVIGIISYSIYIWHLGIATSLTKIHFISEVSGWAMFARLFILSVLIVLPFSFAMYIFIERYFLISSKNNRQK